MRQPLMASYKPKPVDPLIEAMLSAGATGAPVSGPIEGLARMATTGLGGYFAGRQRKKDRDQYDDMVEAMVKGGNAKPWVNPDTGVADPDQAPTGGVEGMIEALRKVPEGNEHAQDAMRNLTIEKAMMPAPKPQEEWFQLSAEDLKARGMDPSIPHQQSTLTKKIRRIGGSGVTVNNIPASDKGPDALGAELGNRYSTSRQTLEDFAGSRTSIGQMKSLLSEGLETGKTESGLLPLRQWAASAGIIDSENVAGQELFNALSNKVVLPLVKQLGTRPTDRDLQFVVDAAPNLANRPEGNMLMLDAIQLADERAKFDYQVVSQWMRENRGRVSDPLAVVDLDDHLMKARAESDLWGTRVADISARTRRLVGSGNATSRDDALKSADAIVGIGGDGG